MKPVLKPALAETTEDAAATQWTRSTRADSPPIRMGRLNSASRISKMDNMSNSPESLSQLVKKQESRWYQVKMGPSCLNIDSLREGSRFSHTVSNNSKYLVYLSYYTFLQTKVHKGLVKERNN